MRTPKEPLRRPLRHLVNTQLATSKLGRQEGWEVSPLPEVGPRNASATATSARFGPPVRLLDLRGKVMRKALLTSAIMLFGLAVDPAVAMPVAPLPGSAIGITQVAWGCGPGWTRGPYGRCHPNGVWLWLRRAGALRARSLLRISPLRPSLLDWPLGLSSLQLGTAKPFDPKGQCRSEQG